MFVRLAELRATPKYSISTSVLLCSFSPLTEIILIAIAGASQRPAAKHPNLAQLRERASMNWA